MDENEIIEESDHSSEVTSTDTSFFKKNRAFVIISSLAAGLMVITLSVWALMGESQNSSETDELSPTVSPQVSPTISPTEPVSSPTKKPIQPATSISPSNTPVVATNTPIPPTSTTAPTNTPQPTATPTRTPNPPVMSISYPQEGQYVELTSPTQQLCVVDVPVSGNFDGLQKRYNINDQGWTNYIDSFTYCSVPPEGSNRYQFQYRNQYGDESSVYTRQFNFHKAY